MSSSENRTASPRSVVVACPETELGLDLCERVRNLGLDAGHACTLDEAVERLSADPRSILLCSELNSSRTMS